MKKYTIHAWVNFTNWEDNTERFIASMTTGTLKKDTSNNLIASSGTIYIDSLPYVDGTAMVGWHLITVSGITLEGTNMNIGASQTPDSYFSGFIDKFDIYEGALTQGQIILLYNSSKGYYA